MKATMKRALAMLLTLVLVIGLLPTGLLSFTAAAEEESVPEVETPVEPSVPEEEEETVETRIIYVNGETGEDIKLEEGAEFPNGHVFKTIQAAVNAVPAKNTIPTTIEIADGAYNVFLTAEDEHKINAKGHTLMIGKSNLTLKAQNTQKVIIYGWSDASENEYGHYNNSVLRIDNSENLTFEGLVILPNFSTGELNKSVTASTYNELVRSFLGEDEADLFVGNDEGMIYFNSNQPMIRTDGGDYATVHSNGNLKNIYGLTFKNCYLGAPVGANAITLEEAKVPGDYHFIGNTIDGNGLTIKGAGNAATVQSEIRDNIITTTTASSKKITLSGTFEKLPVIEGNTFKNINGNIGDTQTLISVGSAAYTAGELAVMCQTNSVANTNAVKYLYIEGTTIKITSSASKVDKVIDSEAELAYWMTQEGTYTVAANIVVTKALPETALATILLGGFTVTKAADLESPAPKYCQWKTEGDVATLEMTGKTLYVDPNAEGASDTYPGKEEDKPAPDDHVFVTIQAAVNSIPKANALPTTIEIADGVYDVYVPAGDANDVNTEKDDYGHGLVIAKSNLTLKAKTSRKVVIYGYTETAASGHHDYNVLRIRNSENLTFDGLVILPMFIGSLSSSSKATVSEDNWTAQLEQFLGADLKDTIVGSVYSTARPMIVTNGYGEVQANGITYTSGLTFNDCHMDALANTTGVIKLSTTSETSTITGDYHFTGNTIMGHLGIDAAGNNATVQNEIRDNIIGTTSGTAKQIKLTGTISKLPVIEGNTFKNINGNIGDKQTVISLGSTTYAPGELAVMCQTNKMGNTNTVKYLWVTGTTIKATGTAANVDNDVDTQEELFYYLEKDGQVTLGDNIELSEALPENLPGLWTMGEFNLTKPASLPSPAPKGYEWVDVADTEDQTLAYTGSYTIYVATTGSDETGFGTKNYPYASIQKAVNMVPSDNQMNVTIEIADGAYNVYVAAGSSNDFNTADAHSHTLVIGKNNLTIKAENAGKAILYALQETDDGSKAHTTYLTVRIGSSRNLTLDGLVIMPSFTEKKAPSRFTSTANAVEYDAWIQEILGDETLNIFGSAEDAAKKLYYNNNNPMVQINSYADVHANKYDGDTISTVYDLTIQNCTFDGTYAFSSLGLAAKMAGKYSLIDNTFKGGLTIDAAAGANVEAGESQITGNIIRQRVVLGSMSESKVDGVYQVTTLQAIQSMPTFTGNTLTGTGNTGLTNANGDERDPYIVAYAATADAMAELIANNTIGASSDCDQAVEVTSYLTSRSNTYEAAMIYRVEHTWSDATCTAPKTCSVCDETTGKAAGHTGGTATCTELAICEVCKEAYGEVLDHSESYTYKDNEDGTHSVTCGVCEKVVIEAVEHAYTEGNCVCGAVESEEPEQPEQPEEPEEPAECEHAYDAGVVTEPTCTANGFTTYTCEKCGYKLKGDEVVTTGHKAVVDAAVPATCTTAGKTEGSHCSVCDEVLVAQEDVPATGHSETYTYTDNGDGTHDGACTVCKEVLIDNAEHAYTDGNCICGAVEATKPVPQKFVSTNTMDLGNSLSLKFIIDPDLNDDKVLELTGTDNVAVISRLVDGEWVIVAELPQSEWVPYTNNRYTAAYDKIAAKEMTDQFKIVIINNAGDPISEEFQSSARDYVMRGVNSLMGNSAKVKQLIMFIDFLNYGAAAQVNFKYKTDDLANALLEEKHQAYATTNVAAESHREGAGGTTASLESRIELGFTFNKTDVTQDMYAVITYTNHSGDVYEETIEGKDFEPYSNGKWRMSVNGLATADGEQMITCTIYSADGEQMFQAKDSVNGYWARVLASTSAAATAELKALASAAVKLSTSAYAFFHN